MNTLLRASHSRNGNSHSRNRSSHLHVSLACPKLATFALVSDGRWVSVFFTVYHASCVRSRRKVGHSTSVFSIAIRFRESYTLDFGVLYLGIQSRHRLGKNSILNCILSTIFLVHWLLKFHNATSCIFSSMFTLHLYLLKKASPMDYFCYFYSLIMNILIPWIDRNCVILNIREFNWNFGFLFWTIV